jgi:hypothetical protein
MNLTTPNNAVGPLSEPHVSRVTNLQRQDAMTDTGKQQKAHFRAAVKVVICDVHTRTTFRGVRL